MVKWRGRHLSWHPLLTTTPHQREDEKEVLALRNSANNREISLNERDTEMSINEDMELPQGTEEALPLKSERAHMISVIPDAVAQPVIVGEKKGLPIETHLVNR
ncbi:uncharacterized protein TNCV_269591 [Trichonephila clavipes]|nr:uncharacterized protein TNCV_269591 [Trichonephila clavipes]